MDSTVQHTIVIFGASGDLTSRKLIPALYRLFQRKRLPEPTRIVGVSRSHFSSEQWREQLRDTTATFAKREFDTESWNAFAEHIYYHPGDISVKEDFDQLGDFLTKIEDNKRTDRVYYLSTMPQLYEPAIAQLGSSGLASEEHGKRRIVIEKPFGTDLTSARHLTTRFIESFMRIKFIVSIITLVKRPFRT